MATKKNNAPRILSIQWFSWLLVVVGIVGLIASSVLTIDKIHVLKDPTYSPPCNINPIFSCGSVMKTKQADIIGAPNTLVGLMAFPVLITVGVVMMFGARMSRRFWQLFQAGILFGLLGIFYLFFQGVYRINALCIYCLSVWVVTLLLVWYGTLWNIQNGYISIPAKSKEWMIRHHLDVIIVVYLLLILAILSHFWYYFGPRLGFR